MIHAIILALAISGHDPLAAEVERRLPPEHVCRATMWAWQDCRAQWKHLHEHGGGWALERRYLEANLHAEFWAMATQLQSGRRNDDDLIRWMNYRRRMAQQLWDWMARD